MNNDDGSTEYAEEYYYNCGYDGCYEPKEKAIIFKCVGRGFKLPPLSQIYVPPFLLKGQQEETENIRPSHHVLELLPHKEASQESNPSEPQSSQKDQPKSNDNNCSESSDLDVYISDEDGASDECDSRPAAMNFQIQNSEKDTFLPINLVCEAECSPSGNKIVVSEIDPAKNALNEKDDSVTSDDEIFSNPSYGEVSGSDNEEVGVSGNNLNITVAGKTNQNNSTNDLNSSTNRCENSSNNYKDPVAEMFSSDESEENFMVTHFRTFKKQVNLSVDSTVEFPALPGKQKQNPQNKCQVENLPENQLRIKNIAKLVLSNTTDANTNLKSDDVKVNQKELKPTEPELLVIENLPQNINKEHLRNFLQQFGQIKNTTLIPFLDRITAKVQYALDADLDWIIHCLDGSRSFGAESEILRCYRE